MSVSQAEDEERRRRNDDIKLKMALERSVSESAQDATNPQVNRDMSHALERSILRSYSISIPTVNGRLHRSSMLIRTTIDIRWQQRRQTQHGTPRPIDLLLILDSHR